MNPFVRFKISWAAFLCLGLVAASNVHAATATAFTGEVDGETQRVTVDLETIGQAAYVPLAVVAERFGGSTRAIATTTHVSFGTITAVIGTNQRRVTASGTQFDLQHPLVYRDGESYVAAEDVSVLFSQAFGVEVRQGVDTAPAEPASEAPALPAESIEPLGPLEPFAVEPLEPMPAPDTDEPDLAPGRTLIGAATTLRGNTVILDPGHGGEDTGFVGASGLREKDLALGVALEVQEILMQTTNLQVYLTRTEDMNMPIWRRIDVANDYQGNLFVSIHTGASPAERAHGFELFFPYGEGGPTRAVGAGRTRTLLGDPLRGHVAESRMAAEAIARGVQARSPAELRGIRQAPLRVAGNAGDASGASLNMPCVLVEIGHLSNATEAALLTTANYQRQLAEGIAAGIAAVMGARGAGS